MAPPGSHALHAYLPATEPYEIWAGVSRGTPEYEKLKAERAQVQTTFYYTALFVDSGSGRLLSPDLPAPVV